MAQDAAQSDIVKKGLLKYRASKVKGTLGSSAQGPKSAKPLFVVFRAIHTGDKIFQVYSSDKKFLEAENPKWKVYLNEATSVYFLENKRSFCVSMSDGGLLFMDTSSLEEAEEWLRCLNAVLYAKGINGENTLQYEVEMLPNSVVSYQGPSVLELRDHDLIVWQGETWDEVLRWKLNHLRSFKAKKHHLTIIAGKRSSTGLGEFVFNSRHSIQITHAIETVVAKVKYRSSPTPPTKNRHASPSEASSEKPVVQTAASDKKDSLSQAVPDTRDPISLSTEVARNSVAASVPDFKPPGTYDFLSETVPPPPEGYGRLEHQAANGPHSQRPKKLSLEADVENSQAFGKLQHPKPARSPRHSPTPPSASTPMEDYGKLEHVGGSKPKTSITSPPQLKTPVIKPSVPGYEDVDLDYGKLDRGEAGAPPPGPLPRPREKSKSPSLNRKFPQPLKPAPYTSGRKSPSLLLSPEERQDAPVLRDNRGSPPGSDEDQYNVLNDVQAQVIHPEGYGRLAHSHAPSDSYGRLEPKGSWECRDKNKVESSNVEESYGKLDCRPGNGKSKQEHGNASAVPFSSQLSEYGHLQRNKSASHRGFDPYGSLPPDIRKLSVHSNTSEEFSMQNTGTIEEESSTPIYSTIDEGASSKMPIYSSVKKQSKKKKTEATAAQPERTSVNGVPPPGYENAKPLCSSMASQVAAKEATTPDGVPPVVPPRTSDKTTPRYQNVGADGKVLLETQPLLDEGLVDNELYSKKEFAAVEREEQIVAGQGAQLRVEAAEMSTSKPTPAPKPKVKPKPKRSTVNVAQ